MVAPAHAEPSARSFRHFGPFEAFYKAEAPPGRRLGIRGIISTEHRDLENERVLQDGLDFGPILAGRGWLNDDHDPRPGKELGIPERVFPVVLVEPDGIKVKATAMEGFLLPTRRGIEVWENARALRGTGRALGFSLEGKKLDFDPLDRKTVTKALVRQIAITRTPVNTRTTLEALEKSLRKAMSVGYPSQQAGAGMTAGSLAPAVPQELGPTVQMFGAVPFDWEAFARTGSTKKAVRAGASGRGTLNKAQALAFIRDRLPDATTQQVRAVLARAAL